MNLHKNRNKQQKPAPANRESFTVDHMPREVATEILCTPKARVTNRERKAYFAARVTLYHSTLEPKAQEVTVAARLKRSSWLQINTWLKRAISRRQDAQRQYNFLTRRSQGLGEKDPVRLLLDRQIKALDVHAFGLDAFRDAIETEIERRTDFCKQLHAVNEGIANKVAAELIGA